MEKNVRRGYKAPEVKFVKLEVEERLLACVKLKGVCPAMTEKNS